MMAAYDLVEIYCELIAARLPIIETQKYVALYTYLSFHKISESATYLVIH